MISEAASWYRQLSRIRFFEETLLNEFRRGIFAGTTHTYLGQEADAVGVLSQVEAGDVVVSNHRCHGHFLAYGGSPLKLFLELMGKPEAMNTLRAAKAGKLSYKKLNLNDENFGL